MLVTCRRASFALLAIARVPSVRNGARRGGITQDDSCKYKRNETREMIIGNGNLRAGGRAPTEPAEAT
ncbi:hypothetical protein PZA11_007147 [Diplocarpon coronariae]